MDVFYNPPITREIIPVHDNIRRMEPLVPTVHINTGRSLKGSRTSFHGSVPCSLHELNEAAVLPADTDPNNSLIDLEKNIASLERSIQNRETVIDIDSGDESRTTRFKMAGRRFLRYVIYA